MGGTYIDIFFVQPMKNSTIPGTPVNVPVSINNKFNITFTARVKLEGTSYIGAVSDPVTFAPGQTVLCIPKPSMVSGEKRIQVIAQWLGTDGEWYDDDIWQFTSDSTKPDMPTLLGSTVVGGSERFNFNVVNFPASSLVSIIVPDYDYVGFDTDYKGFCAGYIPPGVPAGVKAVRAVCGSIESSLTVVFGNPATPKITINPSVVNNNTTVQFALTGFQPYEHVVISYSSYVYVTIDTTAGGVANGQIVLKAAAGGTYTLNAVGGKGSNCTCQFTINPFEDPIEPPPMSVIDITIASIS